MTWFGFIFAAILSLNLSATSVMFPKSLSIHFGGMGAEFPASTLQSTRQMVATELAHGHVKFYHEESDFNNSAQICVEADWETLSRIQNAIDKLPVANQASKPELSLNAIPCTDHNDHQPVPR